jgi:hypothetical protein
LRFDRTIPNSSGRCNSSRSDILGKGAEEESVENHFCFAFEERGNQTQGDSNRLEGRFGGDQLGTLRMPMVRWRLRVRMGSRRMRDHITMNALDIAMWIAFVLIKNPPDNPRSESDL